MERLPIINDGRPILFAPKRRVRRIGAELFYEAFKREQARKDAERPRRDMGDFADDNEVAPR